MMGRHEVPADVAWAAYLISSWWHAETPPPTAAVETDLVVQCLRRNGFPLLTLAGDTRPPAQALLAQPSFAAALEADRSKMAHQQQAFAEIVAAWRTRGIPALFVKAMGPQPTFPYVSNNLDVLVPQARQDAARAAVRALGYVELRHIEEPNKFLFRRYHCGTSAFDLHIHGRLEWHTEFVDSQGVWQRAALAPDCDLALTPAPQDGLLIALAHAAYENKAYKLIELAKFIYASRTLMLDWTRVFAGARERGWLPGLQVILTSLAAWERQLFDQCSLPAGALASAEKGMPPRLHPAVSVRFAGRAAAPVSIPFLESKRLFYEKMLADPSLSHAGRIKDVWTHTLYGTRVRLRLRSQQPHLIALDGIDGSGKSAQAELLALALHGAALRHRVVWTRGGSSRLFQPFFALGRRLLRSGHKPPQHEGPGTSAPDIVAREAQRAHLFRRPVVRRLWPWLVALELIPAYALRIGWPLLRGEVVVADRYLVSTLVEMAARLDSPSVHRTLPARLLRLLAPRAQRTFWFDMPVDVAVRRKGGQESRVFLARQVTMADVLVGDLCAERIDGSLPLDQISDRLVTEILRTYEAQHRTVLNALFCANPRPLREVVPGGSHDGT